LLDRGAAPDEPGTGWMTGTPLHSVCAADDTDAAKILLAAGADPNARQSGGFAPLHAAAQNGNAVLARALLDAGADPAATTDDGTTVVAFAEGSGDGDTVAIVNAALGV
jgi:ankyrin repeat protein